MLNDIRTIACAVPAQREPLRHPHRAIKREAPKPVEPRVTVTLSLTHRLDGLKIGSKDALLVDMVLRPEGATRTELSTVAGWKLPGSAPKALAVAADRANVVLTTRKDADGRVRYFGRYQVVLKIAGDPGLV